MSRKLISFVLALVLLLSAGAFAQDSTAVGWKKSLVVEFLTTQAAYSNSWVGGEVGSFNWTSNLNGIAERQFTKVFNFKSTLKLSFGQTVTQDEEGNWSKPRKSTDLIDWENVGTWKMKIHIDPYVAFRLESQFLDASFTPEKRYMNPIKLTESAGLSHRMYERDKDHITTRTGLAIRQILRKGIVADSIELIGDLSDTVNYHTEDTTYTDGGIEWVTDAVLSLKENLKYTGKLTVFKAFFFSEKDKVKGTEAEDHWKAVDVNWENKIDAQITKLITVSLYVQVLYDKEISKKGRFKETLGIGFKYTLF